jgi:hypothetical protein
MQDLGIVVLSQALEDKARGAEEMVRRGGLKNNDIEKQFWCTLCSKYLSRAAAYRHRDRHARELQKDHRPDALEQLHRTLDEKYGMYVSQHLSPIAQHPRECTANEHQHRNNTELLDAICNCLLALYCTIK